VKFDPFSRRREPQPSDIPALGSIVELSNPRRHGWVERSDAERAVAETIRKGSAKSSQTLARLCGQEYLRVEKRPMYAGRYLCYLPTPLAYETLNLAWPVWRGPGPQPPKQAEIPTP
jgi:hypothetical protein